MELRWILAAWALPLILGETWNVVDISQVVCEKPDFPGAPAFPATYSMTFNHEVLSLNDPYIVSFMRATDSAMTIKFKMEDANGEQVIPLTTVELQGKSSTTLSSCNCLNQRATEDVQHLVGELYGAGCKAWDEETLCGKLYGNSTLGDWCCRKWCYVEPAGSDCPDLYESQLMAGRSYSYAACRADLMYPSVTTTTTTSSTCKWVELEKENDPCACRDMSSVFTPEMQARFPIDYGVSCKAWDMDDCATNYRPDQLSTACCANWCYVDKACSSAIPSWNDGVEGLLFWSDVQCPDDNILMFQCPYKPEPNVSADTRCDCLNTTVPSYWLAFYDLEEVPNYGQECAPHDFDSCRTTFPGATHDMWCCESWCWVNESCPAAYSSTLFPGYFWTDQHCQNNAEAISSCPYSSACECRGQLPSGTFSGTNFADTYGSSCSAWDAVECKAVWGSDADSGWNASADHEWCCDSWCYVNESCPIAKKSWLDHLGIYFSYETCDDPPLEYNEADDTCDAAVRRLSGRRRSGGFSSRSRRYSSSSSSSSSWSSRRRSPPAPPTSARRRSFSQPSYPRRRSQVQLAPRRRATSVAAVYSSAARRRSSVTSPRRRVQTSNTDLRRRRTTPEVAYGYTGRNDLMHTHNGYLPYSTNYGYTSYNSIPPNYPATVSMYNGGSSTGSFASGAFVGAGSMYAYNSIYGDSMHRRRRTTGWEDAIYCIVLAEGANHGAFMECGNCYYYYGYADCTKANSCNSALGCKYTTSQSYTRDDLSSTGFVPAHWTPPFNVTILEISGPGINTDPLSGSTCPPVTAAQAEYMEQFNKTMSFKPELFLVLNKQQVVQRSPDEAAGSSSTVAFSSALLGILFSL